MPDSRRDFLLRFAATALAAAGTGCDSPVEGVGDPLSRREQPLVVYGPPPDHRDKAGRTSPREIEVSFGGGRLDLDARARAILDGVAETLGRDTRMSAVLEGHCDERGSREYNLALGERRAQAARRYLMERGVAEGRLLAVSYGEERPRDPGHGEAAWAANRRVVVRLEPH